MKLPAVVVPLVAIAARVFTGPHPIDDAYITFRYARNFAEGLGLVYNPGEWVLGTTAPLWALLLGVGYRVGATDLPWLATLISALCDSGSALLLVALARRMGWSPFGAGLVGLAWAVNPMSIGFATGGMETSLFVLLTLIVLSQTGASGWRLLAAAALAGTATLVRPEGALLALVVVYATWLWQRRALWRVLLASFAPMCLAGIVLSVRYGSPLPNSVAAKQVAYQPAWPLENAAALLLQAGLPGWSTYLLGVLPTAVGLLLSLGGLLTLVALTRLGVQRLRLQPQLQLQLQLQQSTQPGMVWAWPFGAFAVLYIAFYVAVGLRGVRLFPWYLVPIEPFYLLGLAAGLLAVVREGSRLRAVAPAALVVWQLAAVNWHQPLLPAGEDLAREQLYLAVGQRLADSLPPDAVVAAPEIGALGYASNIRMLDTVGLVSPSALKYYPLPADAVVGDNAIPPRLITDRQPDAVVTLDAFARQSLLPDPAFAQQYQLEASYPSTVWQSQALLVYRRAAPPQASVRP